jgi:hypothetical protein
VLEIFVLRQNKLCIEKTEITQKFVLETTQFGVVVTQKFPTQVRFQHRVVIEQKDT